MASRQTRARDTDRNATVDLIESGYADGQLTREECDTRVGKALVAATLTELHGLTRDLQGSEVLLPSERTPARTPDHTPADPRHAQERRRKLRHRALAAGAAVLLAGGLVWGIAAVTDDPGSDDGSSSEVADGDLLRPQQLASLIEHLGDATASGDPVVFRLFVRRDMATALVPVDQATQEGQSLRYEHGAWLPADDVPDLSEERLDLRRVDLGRVVAALADVENQVEEADASQTVVVFTGPLVSTEKDKSCYRVSASNRFEEEAWATYTCSGTRVDGSGDVRGER